MGCQEAGSTSNAKSLACISAESTAEPAVGALMPSRAALAGNITRGRPVSAIKVVSRADVLPYTLESLLLWRC